MSFLSSLPHAERRRRVPRAGGRALGCFTQALLVLRWFLDVTRVAQLAAGYSHVNLDGTPIGTRGFAKSWPRSSWNLEPSGIFVAV